MYYRIYIIIGCYQQMNSPFVDIIFQNHKIITMYMEVTSTFISNANNEIQNQSFSSIILP